MVKQVINVGANANDGTGDDLRTAMQKINTNFSELYGATAEANDLVEDITPQLGGNLDLQNYIITTSITNGNISLQPNGTGAVLLKNIRITDNVISSDDSTSITVNESLVVAGSANFAGTLSAPTVVTNVIQSDDSSIIEINNGLQVAGSVKSTGVITNTLSSEDSTAIQVGDSLNVNGTVTASTVNSITVNTTELNINNNQILAYNSNSDIKLTTSGTGAINVGGARIKNLATPSAVNDAATKAYVDSVASSVAGVKFTGDDSTGVVTGSGDELQIKGAAGITTAVSGDSPFVLTITGPDLSSYATTTYVDNKVSANNTLTIADDTSSTSSINLDNTLQVLGGNNITTSVSNGILTISGDKIIDVNEINSGDSSAIQINDSINISGNATVSGTINGSLAFSNLTGKPTTVSGYGITDAVSPSTTAITMVGDDSTGTAVTIGETFKITGTSNITTAVSGDTLTITGPNLNNIITVVGDDSTGTAFNAGETLKIAGSGGVTTSVSGDTLTIAATLTGGSLANLSVTNQTISGTVTNGDIDITPNGIGNINLNVAGQVKITDGSNDYSGVFTVPSTQARYDYGVSSFTYDEFNMSAGDVHRVYSNSMAGHIRLFGQDPDNEQISWRGLHVDLITDVEGKILVSQNTAMADPTSKGANRNNNSGGEIRTYSLGPVALGVQNQIRNTNSGAGQIAEGAGISSFTEFAHDFDNFSNGSITVLDYSGVTTAVSLASLSGTTNITNLVGYRAAGNYIIDGTGNVTNYYAFYAHDNSEATNNYGIYVENDSYENYLGGLVVKNSTIAANRSNESLYLSTSGTGSVVVNDNLQVVNTLTANTISTNDISSADSSAIQVNDSVNVNGTLSADSIDTNTISSGDSSAIQISDDLNISGSLTVHGTLNANVVIETSLVTNEISSADSSVIQINDGVNISGTLNAKTIVTNDLISEDSTAIRVLDGLYVSGALTATNVNLSDNLTLTGLLTLGSKTVGYLNSVSPAAGTMAYCTDETGGAQPVFYDGTNWRRMTDRIVIS